MSLGRLDVLVNNAGVCLLQPALEMDASIFDLSIRVMTRGTFLCSRAAARIMIEQGSGGRIINISSILGKGGSLFCAAYSAAKAAIRMRPFLRLQTDAPSPRPRSFLNRPPKHLRLQDGRPSMAFFSKPCQAS